MFAFITLKFKQRGLSSHKENCHKSADLMGMHVSVYSKSSLISVCPVNQGLSVRNIRMSPAELNLCWTESQKFCMCFAWAHLEELILPNLVLIRSYLCLLYIQYSPSVFSPARSPPRRGGYDKKD